MHVGGFLRGFSWNLLDAAALSVFLLSGSLQSGNWPQYLGPRRNAVCPESNLARSWPAGGPPVLWTVSLGPGYGSPAVWENEIYLLDRDAGKADVLRCFDLLTGRELWSYRYDAPGTLSHRGSRTTPLIDGDSVYTCGPFGDVYCFSRETRKPKWHANLWTDFGGTRVPTWGITQHPLLYKDTVIFASQTSRASVVAYRKDTGQVAWKSKPLPGKPGYVAPKIVRLCGEDHLVMISASVWNEKLKGPFNPRPRRGPTRHKGPSRTGTELGVVAGMDPASGTILWQYFGWQCRIPIPNVTAVGNDRLCVTGGYKAGSALIKIVKENQSYAVYELYFTPDFGTHVHPPVLHHGHLYAHCTTNSRRDGMVCMALDSTVKWKTRRNPVFDKGGFLLVGDLILSVDGRKGILYLIEPTPERFKELARAQILHTRECWAPLALVDGKLLLRAQKQLKCVSVR